VALGYLRDIDGDKSSKRLAAFIALACIVAGFVASLTGIGNLPPEWLFTDLMGVVLGGLGLACAERFAPKREGGEKQ